MISSAFAVTAGNSELAAYARSFNNNVRLLPSVVDTDCFSPSSNSLNLDSRLFTVGWIGSPSTAPYLRLLVEPLQLLALELPVRLLVVGGPAPDVAGVDVIEHVWSLEEEVTLINQFDVGVMPLPDSLWSRGKCAYKLIQCMACAIPVIASPVGANVHVVPPSWFWLTALLNGFLLSGYWRQTPIYVNLWESPAARGLRIATPFAVLCLYSAM